MNTGAGNDINNAITRLRTDRDLGNAGLLRLLDGEGEAALFEAADQVRRERYGDAVYIRGLIEFTNCCQNDCYYCGIRRSNGNLVRYRLDKDTILACCREG